MNRAAAPQNSSRPCRLELNNSGAWKLLGTFDASNDAAANAIIHAAGELAAALNDPASGRTALCALRVSSDEAHPVVLLRWVHGRWRNAATGDPL